MNRLPCLLIQHVLHNEITQFLRSLPQHHVLHAPVTVPFPPEASPEEGAQAGVPGQAPTVLGCPIDYELEEPCLFKKEKW